MSLNAVLQHVKAVIDGLPVVLPTQTVTLSAMVQPSAVTPLSKPVVYVWSERMSANQETFTRPEGFQRFKWLVDLYLHYETTANIGARPGVDQEFPLIVSAVIKALHHDPINVMITDPTTGEESQLNAIGDDLKYSAPPEKTAGGQRLVYYVARLTTTAEEWVAG